jgi:cell division protein FtsW
MVDTKLFYIASTLIIIGVIFSYSLSLYATVHFDANQFNFFKKQLIVGVISIVIMWWISTQDADNIIKPLGLLLFVGFFILLAIMQFLPSSMTTSAGGATRWVRFPGFSIAPVEFFKIGFVYFLAWSFSRKISPLEGTLQAKHEILLLAPYFIVIFLPITYLIFVLQNDLGQTVLLGLLLLILSLLAGVRFRLFLSLIFLGVIGAILVIYATNKMVRVEAWWAGAQNMILPILPDIVAKHLKVENLPEPYQINNAYNAIKNGGFFGVGLGNGDLKYGFLSEVHTDFVLVGITEELGFVFLVMVTAMMYMLIHRIYKIAYRVEDTTYFIFSAGIASLIAFSFLINAFGVSGLTPIKGMAVPFLSYGGSSTLALSIGVGMVLSISKKIKL